MEVAVINHILVPLDGSALAECVLPHVLAMAPVTNARITLSHVMEDVYSRGGAPGGVDPVDWHLRKHKSEKYLERIAGHLQQAGLTVDITMLEGNPAECIIEFARNNDVDLIVLSTHGLSGLSGWNVSSVVQKILLRSYKSILLVRAYNPTGEFSTTIRYERLFVGLDCSPRAEYILPFVMRLAQYYKSQLILGTVIQKPQTIRRFPLSEEDMELVNQIVERDNEAVSHYFEQILAQFSTNDFDLKTSIAISENVLDVLHDMVDEANADLVMLVAHGHSGGRRWPYGSVATSFIAYGKTPLMIMQDLSSEEIQETHAELAAKEGGGH
jgi:nucleotide-binding universal stress UspA family protein